MFPTSLPLFSHRRSNCCIGLHNTKEGSYKMYRVQTDSYIINSVCSCVVYLYHFIPLYICPCLCCCSCRPFSVIEGEGFQSLAAKLISIGAAHGKVDVRQVSVNSSRVLY